MRLTIEGVGKLYNGKVWGLRDFGLELGPGVLGLLGPNGAGKSTLMTILATITKATEGRVTWNGVDIARKPDELRAVLGYLPAAGFWRLPQPQRSRVPRIHGRHQGARWKGRPTAH